MRAKVTQHKDISAVMLIAFAGVLAYTLFGVFLMHQQMQQEAALDSSPPIASNL